MSTQPDTRTPHGPESTRIFCSWALESWNHTCNWVVSGYKRPLHLSEPCELPLVPFWRGREKYKTRRLSPLSLSLFTSAKMPTSRKPLPSKATDSNTSPPFISDLHSPSQRTISLSSFSNLIPHIFSVNPSQNMTTTRTQQSNQKSHYYYYYFYYYHHLSATP